MSIPLHIDCGCFHSAKAELSSNTDNTIQKIFNCPTYDRKTSLIPGLINTELKQNEVNGNTYIYV